MTFDPDRCLSESSLVPDGEVDIGRAALALSAPRLKASSYGKYLHHLDKVAVEVRARYEALVEAGSADDCGVRLAALKHVLCDVHAYTGDFEEGNPDNASLIRAIDRAKGAPICLAILYIHAARVMGWDVAGLDVPGLFVCRIEHGGQRIVFDPSDHCRVLEAPDLRAIVKSRLGRGAELSASYFVPIGNRDWLVRMQNIVKLRLIEGGDYVGALECVERMRVLCPDEFRLLLDAGVLYAKTHKTDAAIEALEGYIVRAGDARDRRDATLLLNQLREESEKGGPTRI